MARRVRARVVACVRACMPQRHGLRPLVLVSDLVFTVAVGLG